MNSLKNKIITKLYTKLVIPFFTILPILKYKILSNCSKIIGNPICKQPLLMNGKGTIIFGKFVNIGIIQSPYFFNTYCYIDARSEHSKIEIGDNVWINNNAVLISDGEGIIIGEKCLIGMNFCAFDSDFHDLSPTKRLGGKPKTAAVKIGNNVFIGSNVSIMKGVHIGDNSVIGSGSIVTSSIPSNVVAAGNPCKVLKEL